MTQRMDWRSFENSLKTKARFFSRTAANHLTSIFDRISELQTRDGRPLVVDVGPGTDFHTLYRARVFQSDDKLEAAVGRSDIHLGSPPAPLAGWTLSHLRFRKLPMALRCRTGFPTLQHFQQ
jgi:hypothetical protein